MAYIYELRYRPIGKKDERTNFGGFGAIISSWTIRGNFYTKAEAKKEKTRIKKENLGVDLEFHARVYTRKKITPAMKADFEHEANRIKTARYYENWPISKKNREIDRYILNRLIGRHIDSITI